MQAYIPPLRWATCEIVADRSAHTGYLGKDQRGWHTMELAHQPFVLAVLLSCTLLANVALALEWDYDSVRNGPSNWSRVASPLCGGKKQSPIALWLNELQLLLVPTDIPYLQFDNVNATVSNAKIENNGHSGNCFCSA
ncbi:hypothetical protein D918_05999 [Trichuris suis]|nr:hypothetical protein D918_05999 [Trichuris suis]